MQTLKMPNVYRSEKDQSEITVGVGTSIGAIVMSARQGVVNQRVLVQNDKQLIETFGIPIPNAEDVGIYAGLEFLKESDALYVVRATSGSEKYADIVVSGSSVTVSAGGAGVQARSTTALLAATEDGNTDINNYDLDTPQTALPTGATLLIGAKGPGLYGNNIGITLFTQAITGSATLSGANYDWGSKYDYPAKMAKLSVYVKNDADSTFPTSPEETFYISREYMKDGEGRQLFVDDVINGKSKYIYVVDQGTGSIGTAMYGQVMSTTAGLPVALAGGVDAQASSALNPYQATQGQIEKAWELFRDRSKVSVNILMDTLKVPATNPKAGDVASTRLDCFACLQIGDVSATANTIIAGTVPTVTLQSYAGAYAGWDMVYDSFNDRNVYIPKCVFGGVIMARTDRLGNTWDAPAGQNRGVIPSIGQAIRFSDTDIGNLYDANINTSRFVRGIGNVMWGQKTMQKKKSALDRINVRRLLLYIENSIEPSLVPFLFEPNDEKVRLRAYGIVNSFMNTVYANGGVTKYEVVVDETNNTSQTIDANELIVDVYVQPPKTIEYIRLNIVVTRTGISFSEIR